MSSRIFAPAKINLFLHVTGKCDDGYHTLSSLVAFADIGDDVIITPADEFAFHAEGPFADKLMGHDNLVVTAAQKFSAVTGHKLDLAITLYKKLPVAAGIGGGSADAAATIYGLLQHFGMSHEEDFLPDLLLDLGADVPVCFASQISYMQGIGEKLTPLPEIEGPYIVLVNSGEACSTAQVFGAFDQSYMTEKLLPKSFASVQELITFIQNQTNSLQTAAAKLCPAITQGLLELNATQGCALARMSGSGATCFGLFLTIEDAQSAATYLEQAHPDWWVHVGTLGNQNRF